MTTKFRLLILFCLLCFAVGVVNAQPPGAIQTALDDLNRQTGQSFTLSTVGYQWREEVFDGNNLGCPNIASTGAGSNRVYVIEFDTNFDGVYEWDYRVSVDGSIFLLCSRPAEAVATSQPQPTVPGPTPSSCSGLLPRLSIDVQGRVLPSDPNIIRELPGTSAAYVSEIPVGDTFTVLDGPRCSGAFTWWQVNYNGVMGWTAESDGEEYWLEVFDPNAPAATPVATEAAAPVVCDPALPPRLQRFEAARVTPGDANNVRSEPRRDATKVGEIPGEAEFRVLDGPRCGDGLTWWNVQSLEDSNVAGWTAEGADGDYFVEPPLPRTPITQENVGSLTSIKLWDAPNTLSKILPVSRTTMFVLDDLGYRQVEQVDPFAASEGAEFEEILPLDGRVLADVANRDGFPVLAQITPEGIVVFLPFTEAGNTIAIAGATRVKLNSDGTLLAVVDGANQLSVYDTNDLTAPALIGTSAIEGSTVSDIVFDGSQVFIAAENILNVYDIVPGEGIRPAAAIENDLFNQRLAISPNGQWLAVVGTGEADGSGFGYRLFELLSIEGGRTPSLRWGTVGDGAEYISAPIFTSDSAAFLTTDLTNGSTMLRAFDVESGDTLGGTVILFAGELAFDPSGTQLAVVSVEGDQVQFLGVNEG